MYEVDGQQYLAVYAGGTGIPYGDSAPRGDFLWAFKIGGTVAPAYLTARDEVWIREVVNEIEAMVGRTAGQ